MTTQAPIPNQTATDSLIFFQAFQQFLDSDLWRNYYVDTLQTLFPNNSPQALRQRALTQFVCRENKEPVCPYQNVDPQADPEWYPGCNEKELYLPRRTPDGEWGYFRRARSNGPNTWGSFDLAWHHCQKFGFAGVGFVPREPDGLFFIDLDNVRHPECGRLSPYAQRVLSLFPGTYVEISSSGTGLHIVGFGRVPGPRCRTTIDESSQGWIGPKADKPTGIEMYSVREGKSQFLWFTGHISPGCSPEFADCQQALDELYPQVFPPDTEGPTNQFGPRAGSAEFLGINPQLAKHASDQEIFDRIYYSRSGFKVLALLDGDDSDYNNDASAGDMAALWWLRFWCDNDEERVLHLFLNSARGKRPKVQNRVNDYVIPTLRKVRCDRTISDLDAQRRAERFNARPEQREPSEEKNTEGVAVLPQNNPAPSDDGVIVPKTPSLKTTLKGVFGTTAPLLEGVSPPEPAWPEEGEIKWRCGRLLLGLESKLVPTWNRFPRVRCGSVKQCQDCEQDTQQNKLIWYKAQIESERVFPRVYYLRCPTAQAARQLLERCRKHRNRHSPALVQIAIEQDAVAEVLVSQLVTGMQQITRSRGIEVIQSGILGGGKVTACRAICWQRYLDTLKTHEYRRWSAEHVKGISKSSLAELKEAAEIMKASTVLENPNGLHKGRLDAQFPEPLSDEQKDQFVNLVNPGFAESCGVGVSSWAHRFADPVSQQTPDRDTPDPKASLVNCPRCGTTVARDVPIHEGASVRRDCTRCGRTLSFPVWYGKEADNV